MTALKHYKSSENPIFLTKSTRLLGVANELKPIINRFAIDETNAIESITAVSPVSDEIKSAVRELLGVDYEAKKEGYVILRNGISITVAAEDNSGLQTGLMTFLQQLQDGAFLFDAVWDWPLYETRGVKLMLPGRNEIEDFKQFIDACVYFRHNIVMLEIGGAMEYRRHPEINEGWEEYAAFMLEYSGKSNQIQNNTYPWRKNSIHANNGGGSYLTQDEIKALIDYCERRNLEIIPEVPATSHCDYMLTRHPELAERPEDPYPDTFCPSNPASYELLFDILDEVIKVFNPKIINVGHDEYYSINVCDRCRKRIMDASDIYAEDVTKIHDYLASKGVKTMIWCDKLLDVHTVSGANFGGALNYVYFQWNVKGKLLGIIPATYPARDKIPKDVICLNWMWSFGPKYDEDLRDFHVMFGNFSGSNMNDFKKRCGSNTTGGICSNWGATRAVYLQRNNVYYHLAYNDILFFDDKYDDNQNDQYSARMDEVFKKLFNYRNSLFAENYDFVEVIHSADADYRHRSFCDGELAEGNEYMEKYLLGNYKISYKNGEEELVPVILGQNIGSSVPLWYGTESASVKEAREDGANPGLDRIKTDPRISEMSYSTLPMLINGKVAYRYMMPVKKGLTVKAVTYEPSKAAKYNVDLQKVNF